MNNFNGVGSPLEDKRLTLSGTTNAGFQQYRIWRDSQQILVPKGQSISKPNAPENVQANVGVFGDINRGYFQTPIVEFRNTHNYELFDRFNLAMFRDEFPDDPDVTLEILGMSLVQLKFTLIVNFNGYQWEAPKQILLFRIAENVFQTENSHFFTTYEPYYDQGVQEYNIEFDSYFSLNLSGTHPLSVLPLGNTEFNMTLDKCLINRGSSEYLYNPIFNPTITEVQFSAKDVALVRGGVNGNRKTAF